MPLMAKPPLITIIGQYAPLLTFDKFAIGLSIVHMCEPKIVKYIDHNYIDHN